MTNFQVFITIPIRLGNYLKTLFIYSEQPGVWRYSLLISSCQFLLFPDYLSRPTLAHEYSHLRNQSQQSEKANHDCLTTTNYLRQVCVHGFWINISMSQSEKAKDLVKLQNNPYAQSVSCLTLVKKEAYASECLTSFANAPSPASRHVHCSPVRSWFRSPLFLLPRVPAVQVMPVTKAAPERVVGKLNNAKLFQT